MSHFLTQTAEYSLKLLLALVFVSFLNVGVVSVATFLGAFGLGFGQGLSSIAQNFVAGVIIVSQKIISIGDGVTIGTGSGAFSGEVIAIGLTHTTLKPGEGTHLTVRHTEDDAVDMRVTM